LYTGVTAGGWRSVGPVDEVVGADIVDGDLAVAGYYDKSTGGTPKRDVVYNASPGCTEGLTYDGTTLWILPESFIDGFDLNDDTTITNQIANPANGVVCPFDGTGLAFEAAANSLDVGCSDGRWCRVSIDTGLLTGSGDSGLEMFGLQATNC
jgi:hypothetical protein